MVDLLDNEIKSGNAYLIKCGTGGAINKIIVEVVAFDSSKDVVHLYDGTGIIETNPKNIICI